MDTSLSVSTASSDKSIDFISSPDFSPASPFTFEAKAKPDATQRKSKLRFEGHRGAGLLEPENTMKAFQRAIEVGINGVELDVFLSSDGVPIVVHGTDEGLIIFKDTNLNAFPHSIHSKDLKEWRLPNDQLIPTLEDVLTLCKDRINVNIELKDDNPQVAKATLELIKTMGMLDQVCLSSFNHKHKTNVENARRELNIEKPVEFGFLVWQLEDFGEYRDLITATDSLNIDYDLLVKYEEFIKGQMAWVKEKNIKIKYYFAYDQEESNEVYKRLEDMDIDTLIINYPLKSREFVKGPAALCA